MVKCPICGNKIKEYRDYMDHILLEEWLCCELCNWSYGFVCGAYQEQIGDQVFEWDYTEDSCKEERERARSEYRNTI